MLLGRFRLANFGHGDLIVYRAQEDGQDVGRDNFGIGKAYELLYVTNDEIITILED